MKSQIGVFLVSIVLFAYCQNISAQTQGQMNSDASNGYLAAKAQLEGTVNRILAMYSGDKEFILAFQISNGAWNNYRDAQLKMKFPAKDPRSAYGSMYGMCYSSYLEELTRNRIKELRVWAYGVQEGEGCSGSVHFKQ